MLSLGFIFSVVALHSTSHFRLPLPRFLLWGRRGYEIPLFESPSRKANGRLYSHSEDYEKVCVIGVQCGRKVDKRWNPGYSGPIYGVIYGVIWVSRAARGNDRYHEDKPIDKRTSTNIRSSSFKATNLTCRRVQENGLLRSTMGYRKSSTGLAFCIE